MLRFRQMKTLQQFASIHAAFHNRHDAGFRVADRAPEAWTGEPHVGGRRPGSGHAATRDFQIVLPAFASALGFLGRPAALRGALGAATLGAGAGSPRVLRELTWRPRPSALAMFERASL